MGVIVHSNSFGESIEDLLRGRLPNRRIERYANDLQNEDSVNVNEDGITILNRESVKGQEFDSVFVLVSMSCFHGGQTQCGARYT